MLVSKRRSLVSKKGKNTSQTGKQFRKYFYCFCLAEALLAEAEVEKTPHRIHHAQQIIEVLACVLINLAFVVAMCKQIIMYPSFGPTRPKSDQRQLSHSTYLATDV